MEKGFGFVQDVTADLETGTITSIIVPGGNKLVNMFSKARRYSNTMAKCKMYR